MLSFLLRDNVEAAGADAYNYPGAAEEKSLIEQMRVRWGETLEDSDDDESDDDADMEGDEGAENEVYPLYHLLMLSFPSVSTLDLARAETTECKPQ